MIISEKQILHLMNIANDFSLILARNNTDATQEILETVLNLLDEISQQQSTELKEIK